MASLDLQRRRPAGDGALRRPPQRLAYAEQRGLDDRRRVAGREWLLRQFAAIRWRAVDVRPAGCTVELGTVTEAERNVRQGLSLHGRRLRASSNGVPRGAIDISC